MLATTFIRTTVQVYMLVVMLQVAAWEQLNGDTVPGDLTALTRHFPIPVAITHRR